jgi:hypothetical protein
MPIAREGKFLVTETMEHTPHLGIESSILNDCVLEAKTKGYKGVFGSPNFGFKEPTLDSLLSLTELESIWFWDIKLESVDAVYELKSLLSFGVHPSRPALNFSRIPTLKRLVVEPRPKDSGIETLAALEMLHIWHYAPKTKTFENMALPPNLQELQLNWANPQSLDGLTISPTLKRLEIHRCRNLENISSLPTLFPNLEHLVITTCGKLDRNLSNNIGTELPKLKHAFIQDTKVV